MQRIVYVSSAIAFLLVSLSLPAASWSATGTCVNAACHAGFKPALSGHQPVRDGECESCHVAAGEGSHPVKGGRTFRLAEEGGALCLMCHDPLPPKKVAHPPVAAAECTACHDPHGLTGQPAMMLGNNGQAGACVNCHDLRAKGDILHGPYAVGACSECHAPHGADRAKLLKDDPRETCLRCHERMAQGLKTAGTIHPPVRDDSCTTCHEPHGSALTNLLKTKMPELCAGCHPDIDEKASRAKVRHAALYRELSCGSCHGTHFSEAPKLLFARQDEVCFACHGEDDQKKSRSLRNIAKEVAGKKHLHGPIADGQCSGCHDPHGSDYFRLLSGPYPENFYQPYREGIYDFCLQCHDRNLLRFPDTSLYTKFRNGKQNLHFVHVANTRKGRTCRTCHQPHAADGVMLIGDSGAPFGDWKIPLQYKKTETGGSCAPGCHRALSYDRDKSVDYQ